MKKQRIFTKAIAMLLGILTLFYAIPASIFAEAAELVGSETAVTEEEKSQESYTAVNDVYELTELREENVKHFRNEDGTYVAAQYNTPVHYLDDNGEWQDINNVLYTSGGEYMTSDTRIKFAKKITGNETLFTLHDGNAKITMSLEGARKGVVGTVTNNEDAAENTKLQKLMNLENLSASVLYSDILDGVDVEYIATSVNVKENIIVKQKEDSYSYTFTLKLNNLTAELDGNGNIIISAKDGQTKYTIPAPVVWDAVGENAPTEAAGYSLACSDSGKYTLTVTVDPEWMNADERVFPVTVDPTVRAATSTIVDTYIDSNNPTQYYTGSQNLRVSSTQTAYVVTGTITFIPANAYITSAKLSLYSTVLGNGYIGAHLVTSGWSSKFTYSQFISDSAKGAIESIAMSFAELDSSGTKRYDFDITEAVRKWRTTPSTNFGIAIKSIDGGAMTFLSSESNTINLPSIVVSYKNMTGLEDYNSYSSHSIGGVASGNVNLANGNLVVTIPTVSTTDSIMPYTPILTYNSVMANATNVYGNAGVPYSVTAASLGFKWSMQQSVIKRSYIDIYDETKYYYIWQDADGTEHYFFQSEDDENLYYDDDGMLLKLTFNGNNVLITDTDKTVMTFAAIAGYPTDTGILGAWHLGSITDNVGNQLCFTSDETTNRPVSVVLDPMGSGAQGINTLEVGYVSGSVPTYVYNSVTGLGTIFVYSNTYNGTCEAGYWRYLRKVLYIFDKDVTDAEWKAMQSSGSVANDTYLANEIDISYTSAGYISEIKETVLNYTIKYTYSGKKLSSITEYGGSTMGQKLSYTYGSGYSDVRSSGNDDAYGTNDDIITRYVFDNYGRAVSTYSKNYAETIIYGATSGIYETQDNIKNNLKETTVTGGSGTNFILNGGFESYKDGAFEHWTKTANVSRNETISADGYYNAKFEAAENTTDSLKQYVYLPGGDYTISFNISSVNMLGNSVRLRVKDIVTSEYILNKEIAINERQTDNTDFGYTTVIDVSESFEINTDKNLEISISVIGGNDVLYGAVVYVDRVMLEEGIGASEFNMVNMGGFEDSAIKSDGSDSTDAADVWTVEGSEYIFQYSEQYLLGRSAKLYGDMNRVRYMKQRIYEVGDEMTEFGTQYFPSNANKTYIVSGYGKAENFAISDKSKFRIKIEVGYQTYRQTAEGQQAYITVVPYSFDFVPGCDDWQFVSGSFSTDLRDESGNLLYKYVKYIDVVCEYSYQLAETYALFDNISVVDCTNNSVKRYEYYPNGMPKISKSTFLWEYYEYDDDKNLTRAANNKGELYDYDYNSNGTIASESYSTFVTTAGESTYYPINMEDPDSLITKTEVTRTEYTYNVYGLCTESITTDVSGTQKQIKNSYTYYTTDNPTFFGTIKKATDSLGNDTVYFYEITGGNIITVVIDVTSREGMSYVYDIFGKLKMVLPATYINSNDYLEEFDAESVRYTYNVRHLLNTIKTVSTTYTFGYDSFGNPTAVAAGDNTLVTYTYNQKNGKLIRIDYGNSFSEEYVYNDLENLSEIWYTQNGNRTKAYGYTYTSGGQLYRVDDYRNGESIVYSYDSAGRLISYAQHDTEDTYQDVGAEYTYNDDNLLSWYTNTLTLSCGNLRFDHSVSHNYTYNADKSLSCADLYLGNREIGTNYNYDTYDRLIGTSTDYGSFESSVGYTYSEIDTSTSAEIATYTSTVNQSSTTYTYTYDSKGNITKIDYGNGTEVRYVYDNLGQLLREDNQLLGKTFVYTYDNAGNITSKKSYALTAANVTPTAATETKVYGYSSSDGWGDKLTSYGGNSITYDTIGNPLSYYNGFNFTWTGRQLTGATNGQNSYSFTYNDEGIRTSKTVNGITTTYYLSGTTILAEVTNGSIIFYLYDSSGSALGMQYSTNGTTFETYWFEKNLQGDIVAVYSDTGVKLVSYIYDAWGNFTISYHNSGAATNADKNNLTYRGYYYDSDLGLYYLNSRYYDSVIHRFINADNALYHSILGSNMYAYCKNNPVNFVDHSGESAEAITTFFWWLWTVALAEPTPAGEIVAGVITVVGGIAIGYGIVEVGELISEASQSNKKEDVLVAPPQSITQQNTDDSVAASSKSEIKNNNDYDPNPYGRPGEKKQNRENRNKSRTKDGWKPRNNKRDGKPAKPKSHTPSKKGHKKYFSLNSPIYIFDF